MFVADSLFWLDLLELLIWLIDLVLFVCLSVNKQVIVIMYLGIIPGSEVPHIYPPTQDPIMRVGGKTS